MSRFECQIIISRAFSSPKVQAIVEADKGKTDDATRYRLRLAVANSLADELDRLPLWSVPPEMQFLRPLRGEQEFRTCLDVVNVTTARYDPTELLVDVSVAILGYPQ